MGCYSVYCVASHIAISGGEDVVFMPLMKSSDTFSYEWCLATLPIFGKYNEYGCITDIVEDDNTRLIEKSFDMSINDFCRQIARSYWEPENVSEKLKGYTFCWMLKDVYDLLSGDTDRYGIYDAGDVGRPKNLERLGFTKVEGVKSESDLPDRFCHVYTLDGKFINTDHRWVHLNGKNLSLDREDIGRLFPSANREFLFGAKPWEWMGDRSIAVIGKLIGCDGYLFEFRLIPGLKETFLRDELSVNETIYDEVILDKNVFFLDFLSDVFIMWRNMIASCCPLEPMVEGIAPQGGEYEQQKEYFEKYLEIVTRVCEEIGADE